MTEVNKVHASVSLLVVPHPSSSPPLCLPVLFLSICKAELGVGGTEVELGSLNQREPVLLTGKSNRQIKGGKGGILEEILMEGVNGRGREKRHFSLCLWL